MGWVGWKSPKASILRAPLCGANNDWKMLCIKSWRPGQLWKWIQGWSFPMKEILKLQCNSKGKKPSWNLCKIQIQEFKEIFNMWKQKIRQERESNMKIKRLEIRTAETSFGEWEWEKWGCHLGGGNGEI